MAGLPLKPDMETTSDADWLIASKRAGALEALLAGSTPAVVAEVARELKLGPAMVYRLLALAHTTGRSSKSLLKYPSHVVGTTQSTTRRYFVQRAVTFFDKFTSCLQA